ncbi:MAG: hypothetical protein GF331_21080 [Chitinivibrionales bacterium]|nr:hypothetical protein [Chitinivibrionales bacterium]
MGSQARMACTSDAIFIGMGSWSSRDRLKYSPASLRRWFYALRLQPLLAAGLLGMLLVHACVERDNPWDPVNYTPRAASLDCSDPEQADPVRDSLEQFIAERQDSVRALAATLTAPRDSATAAANTNATVLDTNTAIRHRNELTQSHNDSVEARNDTITDVRDASLLDSLDTLISLRVVDTLSSYKYVRDAASIVFLRSDSAIAAVNSRCLQGTIVSDSARLALLAPFDSVVQLHDSIMLFRRTVADAALDTNGATVVPYNATTTVYNAGVRAYNDSLRFLQHVYAYGQIADPAELETSLAGAQAGDTLVLAGGTFVTDIRFNNSGTLDSPIVIIGQPSMTSVLRQSDVVLSNNSSIRFENVVFHSSLSSGVKLEAGSQNVVFRRCWFESNATHGLELVDADARLIGCRILNNGGLGIRCASGLAPENRLNIHNTLIAHNRVGGIEALTVVIYMQNVTLADNGRDGLLLLDPELDLYIHNSLVTGNSRYGLRYESSLGGRHPLVIVSTVFDLNTSGALAGVADSTVGILSLPVEYVDPSNDNYDIVPGSEVDRLEQQGIVVGYRRQ